ncbi:MAG: hypothetical protein ABSC49_03050 [Candidatus Microgenomates bacterium]|jgi:hypothetical protein
MPKELEPIVRYSDNLGTFLTKVFIENQGDIQPVVILTRDQRIMGRFRVSVVTKEEHKFAQIENLDPIEFADTFTKLLGPDWEMYTGGIFRAPIDILTVSK